MRKLLLKTWLLLLCMIVGGASSTWATDYSLTPDKSSTGSSASTYITTLTEFEYEGISWNMNQWNPKTLQVKTNQSSAASQFRFYNTSAFPGRITKVVITFSTLTIKDATLLMFKGGTSKVDKTTEGTAGTWDSENKTLTWTPGASDDFTYFAFYQNGKAASGTNYLASENAIVVTYESGTEKQEPELSYETTVYNVPLGDDSFVAPSLTNPHNLVVSYASSNEDVAVVNAATGDVVLDTSVEGTATITASFAGDATYKAGSASYTINVVDSRAEAGLSYDETEINVNMSEADQFVAPTLNNPNGLTVTYSSSDDTIVLVDEGTGEVVVSPTVGSATITATFAGSSDYKPGNASYTITVVDDRAEAGLSFDKASVTVKAGEEEAFVAPTLINPHNLLVMYSSNNDGVAMVDENTGEVVFMGDMGVVTVTATFAGNPSYKAGVASYNIVVKDGNVVEVLNETFAGCEGAGGNDGVFNPSSTLPSAVTDLKGWTLTNAYGSDQCLKMGTAKKAGVLVSPTIPVVAGSEYTLTFKAAPWNTESTTMVVAVTGGSIDGLSTDVMANGDWSNYVATITVDPGVSELTLTFTANQNRFFIDDIVLEGSAQKGTFTISAAGKGTLYAAHAFIMPDEVVGKVIPTVGDPNGEGEAVLNTDSKYQPGTVVPAEEAILLEGEANTYTYSIVCGGNATEGNMLKGSLTTVTPSTDGVKFYMLSYGTGAHADVLGFYYGAEDGAAFESAAGKCWLEVPASSGIKSLVFDGGVTGLDNTSLRSADSVVYDLSGRRVAQPVKGGLYIVNGKKVLVK